MIKNDELSSRLLLGTCSPLDIQSLGKHLRFSYLFSRFSSKKGPFWPGNQPGPDRIRNGTSLVGSTMSLHHLTIICNKISSIFTCISHKNGAQLSLKPYIGLNSGQDSPASLLDRLDLVVLGPKHFLTPFKVVLSQDLAIPIKIGDCKIKTSFSGFRP